MGFSRLWNFIRFRRKLNSKFERFRKNVEEKNFDAAVEVAYDILTSRLPWSDYFDEIQVFLDENRDQIRDPVMLQKSINNRLVLEGYSSRFREIDEEE